MLLKISWRNIWRSPLRSLVVMGSIAVGTWSIIALLSFSYGMVESYVNNAIRFDTSHFQLHNPTFKEDQEVQAVLTDPMAKLETIQKDERVAAVTVRTLVTGMLVAPKSTRGIIIRGVEDSEPKVTEIDTKIVEGSYFKEKGKNQIIVGRDLAEKLGVGLRKKVVLQFQNMEGDITAGAFRIVGMIDSGNKLRDEGSVFVKRTDINRLLGDENAAHEIAVYLKDSKEVDAIATSYQNKFSNSLVEPYQELSPDIKLYETQIGSTYAVFVGIFMLALIFGIINTMLMAVLERNKELGMLMAVGMNKYRIFGMIVLETLLLGIVSAIVGLILGFLTVKYLNVNGVDLSAFADGLKQFGMSSIIRPAMKPELFTNLAISVLITSLLGSIYPALKAIRLKPVEAIRKI